MNNIRKTQIESYIKQALNHEFNGSCKMYTLISILGATRDEVEKTLIEAFQEQEIKQNTAIVGCSNIEKDSYDFCIWGYGPQLAQYFSKKLPQYLVVGDTSWDYTEIKIYKNGKEAEPFTDYEMNLSFNESETESCFDISYTITDTEGHDINGGSGMVYSADLILIQNIATHTEDITYPYHER